MSKEPVEITSVSEWNTTLRAAKAAGETVVVDFHAQWCGPCKQIAPTYTSFASQYPFTHFLRVDVDGPGTKSIAAKYQISAMPTFIVIKPSSDPEAKTGQVVETLRGADPQGLRRMIAAHASHAYSPNSTLPSVEAEEAKKKGNMAFAENKYADAVEAYTRAIELAPKSGVLYANRALAYVRLIQLGELPVDERKKLRPKALQDAQRATELEGRWGKAHVRLAEALMLAGDEESLSDVGGEEKRKEGKVLMLDAVADVLENAVHLSEGKVRQEAQNMLEEVRKRMKA